MGEESQSLRDIKCFAQHDTIGEHPRWAGMIYFVMNIFTYKTLVNIITSKMTWHSIYDDSDIMQTFMDLKIRNISNSLPTF